LSIGVLSRNATRFVEFCRFFPQPPKKAFPFSELQQYNADADRDEPLMFQAKKVSVEVPAVRLSKSRIAEGLVCEKKAYLSIFSPDLKAKVTKSQHAQFDVGNEVGERARLLFPGGHLVDRKPWEIKEAQAETQDVIEADGKTIFEATFGDDEYHCRVDVLQRDSAKSPWNIFEVKSGLDPKPEYVLDLAIQCWILNRVGIQWEKAHLILINRACRHPDLSNMRHYRS